MQAIKSHGIVLLLVFASGFTIMSVEMLGGRILAPYFGSSVYVWGSLIFTFMVGLSIGYGVGGKLSVKHYGRRILALILLLGGVQIVLMALSADAVLLFAFNHTSDPRSGSLAAALALYLLPTATLGMLSPVAIRTISEQLREVGRHAGMLYLVSTLGSAVGTLVTAFWLVAVFDVNSILLGNAALLMAGSALGVVTHKKEVLAHA